MRWIILCLITIFFLVSCYEYEEYVFVRDDGSCDLRIHLTVHESGIPISVVDSFFSELQSNNTHVLKLTHFDFTTRGSDTHYLAKLSFNHVEDINMVKSEAITFLEKRKFFFSKGEYGGYNAKVILKAENKDESIMVESESEMEDVKGATSMEEEFLSEEEEKAQTNSPSPLISESIEQTNITSNTNDYEAKIYNALNKEGFYRLKLNLPSAIYEEESTNAIFTENTAEWRLPFIPKENAVYSILTRAEKLPSRKYMKFKHETPIRIVNEGGGVTPADFLIYAMVRKNKPVLFSGGLFTPRYLIVNDRSVEEGVLTYRCELITMNSLGNAETWNLDGKIRFE